METPRSPQFSKAVPQWLGIETQKSQYSSLLGKVLTLGELSALDFLKGVRKTHVAFQHHTIGYH